MTSMIAILSHNYTQSCTEYAPVGISYLLLMLGLIAIGLLYTNWKG
jgi:hypothetical protein